MSRTTRKKRAAKSSPSARLGLKQRLLALVAELHPFALSRVTEALGEVLRSVGSAPNASAIDGLREPIQTRLRASLKLEKPENLAETTPGVAAEQRLALAQDRLIEDVDGFLVRESIAASFSEDERREMLRGMVLTRAVDNQLKAFFLGGQVRYGNAAFQGKGFRSLGQEAIYAAPLRLLRGADQRDENGQWAGDVIAPLIRDLGAALCMRPDAEMVRMVLRAQMGKAGAPMDGRDLHIGDMDWGVLPASAPLSISTMTVAGLAMAFARRDEQRVAVSFIGEGGSSLGEWHEAINVCAAGRLPAIFCVQNNQTALSTPLGDQSAVRVFADKAQGYGIPGLTIDGTDPEAVAAAFAWAAGRAREGAGPTLIELVAMRMCGHAHHDDMLYLGREPEISWDYPEPGEAGYAQAETYAYWAERDPLKCYAARLVADGILPADGLETMKSEAEALVQAEARHVIDAPWPDPDKVGSGVFAEGAPAVHIEPLGRRERPPAELPPLDPGPPIDPGGQTFLEAIKRGVGDALRTDPRTFVYGQDVGGRYGNAFLLLRPLLEEFGERIVNSPLCEGGVLGVCVGSALAGMRPIGEIQFNDFVATGFNQLVNNAAKVRYRWGGSVPMVVRLPWGGLRKAGPYHSQNTEPWFYRTPGLKIVAPSTPHDARALLLGAVADPDPVLFYEHIGLYRDPKIKQRLDDEAPTPMAPGKAALRRAGSDLALVSYGAYVHVALRVADALAHDGIEASVLDLRSLAPLDRPALEAVARHCGKVLIVHEDSRTGGIGESLAATLQETIFEELDAPIRIVGALDTPVPYSPPLEEAYLVSTERVERAARLLAAY